MSDLATPTAIVSPEWAQQHLDDPGVRFVEADFDTAAYEQGHLPGAVCWSWDTDLTDPLARDLASRGSLAALLSRSGIDAESHIVLYGEDNWYAAWACWQLGLFGVDRVSLLDGGRRFWLEHDLPLSTAVPTYPRTTVDLPEPGGDTRIFAGDIVAGLERTDALAVDVREPDEFDGRIITAPGYPPIAQRAGHIPGAVSAPWGVAVDDEGMFRAADDLQQLYQARGITRDRALFTYCGVGVRSSHTWFVLKRLLGYPDVRNYDGSWAEWGSMIGVPIESSTADAARQPEAGTQLDAAMTG